MFPSRHWFRTLAAGCCLLGALLAGAWGVQADPAGLWREDEQRLRIGLKLFPAFLGAMEGLEGHRGQDGRLRVLVLYQGARAPAVEAAERLGEVDGIRGSALVIEILRGEDMPGYAGGPPAGIFVASLGVDPKELRAWSERYRTLVFSPFAGAVEDGAVAGLYVADRILPYVNLKQAARAQVRFKPFFLQVARHYEGN
ncbi:hypothetical protein [Thiocystis violacea]|uniref:hypothetical protein n=1 Tax=Thiocystis violacea TaxID=13725 RepID=UPI00190574A2|nr:hypothetical protein [Thiocystis violacea]MBK1721135.1 hypothetical protein [Thiocystis violacea]